MAFWENVNAGLKKAVDEGWTAVRDSAKIGKNRYKLHTLHKQAETLFTEIGGIVYDMADSENENPLSRPEVRDLIDDIKRIEAQSADIEVEIEQTREKDKPDDAGGAEEGAWPAAVSKEVYVDDDDDITETVISEAAAEDEYAPEQGDIDDDTLGATGDPQADDFGEGVDDPDEPDSSDADSEGADSEDDTEGSDRSAESGKPDTEEERDS